MQIIIITSPRDYSVPREEDLREWNDDSDNRNGIIASPKVKAVASTQGLDKFTNRERGNSNLFDGSFAIDSYDQDDVARRHKHNSNSNNNAPLSPNDDTPSLWSSRYSVERQRMAITGENSIPNTCLQKWTCSIPCVKKIKRARGLYRASGHAMDGSREEYNDNTCSSSTGVELGSNIWLWFKGTLCDLELNYDGLTNRWCDERRPCNVGNVYGMDCSF
jgi:hypothetical protein